MKKSGSKSFNRRMKAAKKIGAALNGNGGLQIIREPGQKFHGLGRPKIVDFRYGVTIKEDAK